MSSKITAIFTENWGIKLVSLLLALLLELYFYSPDNSVTRVVTASLVISNVPKDMVLLQPTDASQGIPAQFEVTGPRTLVEKVQSAYSKIEISPPEYFYTPTLRTIVVNSDLLGLPPGVTMRPVTPRTLSIQAERLLSRKIPIVISKIGEANEGYEIKKMEIQPRTVIVRGPKSSVAKLRTIETEPVFLSELKSTKRFEVPLSLPDPLVDLEVKVANISVSVAVTPIQKDYRGVRVKVLAPPGYAATVEPPKVQLRLSGPDSEISAIQGSSIELFADGRKLTGGRHLVQLSGAFPEGVKILYTRPERVIINLVTTDG